MVTTLIKNLRILKNSGILGMTVMKNWTDVGDGKSTSGVWEEDLSLIP